LGAAERSRRRGGEDFWSETVDTGGRSANHIHQSDNVVRMIERFTMRHYLKSHRKLALGIFQAVCDSSVFSGLLMPAWVGGPAAMGLVWNRSGCAQSEERRVGEDGRTRGAADAPDREEN